MPGLDEGIAGVGGGGVVGLIVALLLGLRHASDRDHLTAVSTLVLSDERHGGRRAGQLGLAWGFGHAATLFAFGLPVVLFGRHLPDTIHRAAELAIGAVIVGLAVRLLLRWRRGCFHAHPHSHGALRHAHPHAHEHGTVAERITADADRTRHGPPPPHAHPHAEALGRTPLAAFGIGLVHGVGGSAGVGVLLIAALPGRALGVVALLLFAGGTAVSMAVLSSAFGYALARGPLARRLTALVPVFGGLSLLFGVWYALGTLETALS